MSKKKVTEKKPATKASRSVKKASAKPAAPQSKPVRNLSEHPPRLAEIHAYSHAIHGNPDNAPLIVDIPIAQGRGEHPPRPSFVSFTAEMSEEHWPDQFAFRVISLEGRSVRVMISRIDKDSQELGWGVTLIVHVLVVDLPGA